MSVKAKNGDMVKNDLITRASHSGELGDPNLIGILSYCGGFRAQITHRLVVFLSRCRPQLKRNNPSWSTTTLTSGNVRLEVRRAARRGVDVDGDRVDLASAALFEERVHPRLAVRRPGVRDCGADELGLTGERLHVLLPRGRGRLRCQVRLTNVVGLVETDEGD
jgi:hypothetical protein